MCIRPSIADQVQEIAARHTATQLQPSLVAQILPRGMEMLGVDAQRHSLSEREAQSRLDHLVYDPCPLCEEALGMKLQDICPHPQFTLTTDHLESFPETGALGRVLRRHRDECETCAANTGGKL